MEEVKPTEGKIQTMQAQIEQQTQAVPPPTPAPAPMPAAVPVSTPPAPKKDDDTNKEPKGLLSESFEFVWETAKVILVSLIIIVPVRYFLIQPFFVKGSSMVPNFHDKEYILVDKWTYRLGQPDRGDVIVFKYPGNPKEYFIKRIIGLPGETVLVPGDNTVHIFNSRYPNGFVLNESGYLPKENPTYCSANTPYCGKKVTLADDEYFVLGDNREHSSDGRFFGPVKKSVYFAGLAWLRLFPFNRVGFISRTDYPPVVQ